MVSNHETKDMTDLVKMYMYAQKLFNPAVSAKMIRHVHSTLPKTTDYAQKIKRFHPCLRNATN